jgi:hypothetical protein
MQMLPTAGRIRFGLMADSIIQHPNMATVFHQILLS